MNLRPLEKRIGAEFSGPNRIDVLVNGHEIFPAMLAEIRRAREVIHFVTYVYWQGEIAEKFADALADRARAGVRCHVLLDAFGAHRMRESLKRKMTDAGVIVCHFHPFSLRHFTHLNQRTHRKILVIDHRVGFIGGVGIADEWTGDAKDARHWHDLHFRFFGPAVSGLERAFCDNWNEVDDAERLTSHPWRGDSSLPAPLEQSSGRCDDTRAQVVQSSPRAGWSESYEVFRAFIENAESSVRIETAYFVPDDLMVEGLSSAVERGVKVEIIFPTEHCDSWLAHRKSRARWRALLERGVRLFRYLPTMCHSKMMLIDDAFATIGSINFDIFSFRMNDEANVNVQSEKLSRILHSVFEHDLDRCRELTLDSHVRRPAWQRLEEQVAEHIPLPV